MVEDEDTRGKLFRKLNNAVFDILDEGDERDRIVAIDRILGKLHTALEDHYYVATYLLIDVANHTSLSGRLDTVTVAPLTSTVRGVPSEVVVGPDVGLKRRSAVNLHHVATVPRAGLRTYVGTISPDAMRAVRESLLFALGFDPE